MTLITEELVEKVARKLREFEERGRGSTLLTVLAAWVEDEFPNAYEQAIAENFARNTIAEIARAALSVAVPEVVEGCAKVIDDEILHTAHVLDPADVEAMENLAKSIRSLTPEK